MAGRFRPRPDLEQRVVEEIAAPIVDELKDRLVGVARGYAPPERVWMSMADALVRPTHAEAHGQAIAGNLRFILRTPQYDREHYDPHEFQQLRRPGDRDGGTIGNTINCRCYVRTNPEGVSQTIDAGPTVTEGSRAWARVGTRYPRAADSEYGTDKDEAARFFGQAVRDVRGVIG